MILARLYFDTTTGRTTARDAETLRVVASGHDPAQVKAQAEADGYYFGTYREPEQEAQEVAA